MRHVVGLSMHVVVHPEEPSVRVSRTKIGAIGQLLRTKIIIVV